MRYLIFGLLVSSLAFSADINQKILFAAARGEVDSLEIFLSRDSVNMSYRWENGYSALDYAIERNYKDAFLLLANHYSSADPINTACNDLLDAILKNDNDLVRQLLRDGSDPNTRHASGYYPLSLAVRWGSVGIVKLLLDAGADVNGVNLNRYKTFPLIENTRNGNTDIASLLLSKHANIDQVDVNNDPPINWATYYNQIDLVKLLVEADANLHIRGTDSGDDAMAIAKRMKHAEIEKLLNGN